MRRILLPVACAAIAALLGACNDVGDCPAPAGIVPGGSCSGDSLQCAYTLESLSPACDGTTVAGGIATSCVCTQGSWSCPSPVSCPAAPGDAGDEGATEAGGDAAAD